MKFCRFLPTPSSPSSFGLLNDNGEITELSDQFNRLSEILELKDLAGHFAKLDLTKERRFQASAVRLLAPIDHQEVWAAGVTYLRSKTARMDESEFSATAYDRVYEAARPEIFFKATAHKVVGPRDHVGIRADATWSVPEPELALVLNSRGEIAGYTIGNDMSSRDIEGENLLYLPQAKIYRRSCALGPCIVTGAGEAEARQWEIQITIQRANAVVFQGKTNVGQIKRTFAELAQYLFRSQEFPLGAVLLTGTGVVPADDFTLQAADQIRIEISGIGALENSVKVV
ncbi:MAG TPA: fumarylacetoacetate hydrolase family protein [Verrucomicrobiae bacterium]|nr:fumarylacetoacetate hydrolase family protein [Verrucomicrobiae bacterium]